MVARHCLRHERPTAVVTQVDVSFELLACVVGLRTRCVLYGPKTLSCCLVFGVFWSELGGACLCIVWVVRVANHAVRQVVFADSATEAHQRQGFQRHPGARSHRSRTEARARGSSTRSSTSSSCRSYRSLCLHRGLQVGGNRVGVGGGWHSTAGRCSRWLHRVESVRQG